MKECQELLLALRASVADMICKQSNYYTIKQWLTQHGEKDHEASWDLYNPPAPNPCRPKQPNVLPASLCQTSSVKACNTKHLQRHSGEEEFGIDTHTETVEPVPVPKSPSRRMPIPCCSQSIFFSFEQLTEHQKKNNHGCKKVFTCHPMPLLRIWAGGGVALASRAAAL